MPKAIITCGIFLYSQPAAKFLVCHATNARWTQWSIPKGLPELREQELDAAIRELFEETGINESAIGEKKVIPLPASRYQKQNKELHSFLVLTAETFENHVFKSAMVPDKNIPEVDSWKWITLEEAGRWLHDSQARLIDTVREIVGRNTVANSDAHTA